MSVIRVQQHEVTEEACSNRGALLLDDLAPGWAFRVTRPIVMIDPNKCVAGQVFSNREYDYGSGYGYLQDYLVHVKEEPIRQVSLPDPEYGGGYREYSPTMYYGFSGKMPELESCWRALIVERLTTGERE